MSDPLTIAPASSIESGSPQPKPDNAKESVRLVSAIQAGDRHAESLFTDRYLRPVRAMLLARTRNPDLASDLQQDVMIEAICALRRGQLREPSKLTAFVVAIARNVLNHHFRSLARHPESLEAPENLPDMSAAQQRVEEQMREDSAMCAIASLEPTDRKILEMTLVDGLKPGVIAERLHLNPEVVRQRKLRATRRVIEFIRRQSQTVSFGHLDKGSRR